MISRRYLLGVAAATAFAGQGTSAPFDSLDGLLCSPSIGGDLILAWSRAYPHVDMTEVAIQVSQLPGVRLAMPVAWRQLTISKPGEARKAFAFCVGLLADDLAKIMPFRHMAKIGGLAGFEARSIVLRRRTAEHLRVSIGELVEVRETALPPPLIGEVKARRHYRLRSVIDGDDPSFGLPNFAFTPFAQINVDFPSPRNAVAVHLMEGRALDQMKGAINSQLGRRVEIHNVRDCVRWAKERRIAIEWDGHLQ